MLCVRILPRLARLIAVSMALALQCGLAVAGAGIDRLVTFGTSLSDMGNAFVFLSDPANQGCGVPLSVPPYDTLDDLVVPDGPYARGGHHFTNGATWLEGLANFLGLQGNARPALRSAPASPASNYAVGGARAVTYPCRFNLPEQLAAYLAAHPQTSANTLVVIEMGGNDVRDALVAAALGGNPVPIIQNALASVANTVAALYASGARKFLVVNVPDLAKAPSVRLLAQQVPAASAAATQLSMAFDAGLANVVQYAQGLGGTDVRVLDLFALLNEVVSSPGSYGFTNATDPCVTPNVPPFHCARPDQYVFWDGVHPTSAMHAIMAQRAIAVMSAP